MSRATYTTDQFIMAIPGTGGIISAIARKVGCGWHTAARYIDQHATVKQAYDDECERVLDLAETKTIKAIEDGDLQMVRYYLSTKGRKRGYVERTEQEVKQSGAVTFRVVYGDDGSNANGEG